MIRRGIPVSPGIIIGTAYCIQEVFVNPDTASLLPAEVPVELERFEAARRASLAELSALHRKVSNQVGSEAAEVFAVHRSILEDPVLLESIRRAIGQQQRSAQGALSDQIEHYRQLLQRNGDAYLQERLGDVRDVFMRLSSHLSEALREESGALPGPLVIVAEELLPSTVVLLGDRTVEGIVTEAGSQTSHAAILARSRGIPAVAGVRGVLQRISTGDTLIVDGQSGQVIVRPTPEQLEGYRQQAAGWTQLWQQLTLNRRRPARLADGEPISLLANINHAEEAKTACRMGSSGVGLCRTEYLFLACTDMPQEDEQVVFYQRVIRSSPNRSVTIRTLDIGGDKSFSYHKRHQSEANPFMGSRSVRLSLEHPEYFITQVRAILRAAATDDGRRAPQVQILFPMVTLVEELKRLKSLTRRATHQLQAEGLPYGEVDVGIMIEVPGAAMILDQLLPMVDFISIGSNDLVQYLMAADRDNPKVSHLCQPLAPAVLRMLKHCIDVADRQSKPITLCGEMAGQPDCFALLLGMGLRRFSTSPAFVPSLKELASHLTVEATRRLFELASRQTTVRHVQRLVRRELLGLAPHLEPILSSS